MQARLPKQSFEVNAEVEKSVFVDADPRLNSALNQMWANTELRVFTPLQKLGLEKSRLSLRSTSDQLTLYADKGWRIYQRSADFSIVLGEKLIEASLNQRYGGQRFSETELLSNLSFLQAGKPFTDQASDDLLIYFPKEQAISFEIGPSSLTLSLRPKKFQKQGEDSPPLVLKISYDLSRKPNGTLLLKMTNLLKYTLQDLKVVPINQAS